MSEPSIAEWHAITCQSAKNNADVIDFCSRLCDAFQVWDDIVDRDAPVSAEDVCRVFWSLIVAIPENAFYQAHRKELLAIIKLVINDWFDSLILERSEHADDRVAAYGLRSQSARMLIQVAGIVGGFEHMREISRAVTALQFKETLGEYLESTQYLESDKELL